jgi:hypothetical protein
MIASTTAKNGRATAEAYLRNQDGKRATGGPACDGSRCEVDTAMLITSWTVSPSIHVNQPGKPFLLERRHTLALLAGSEKLNRKQRPYHKSGDVQKQAYAVLKNRRSPCRTTWTPLSAMMMMFPPIGSTPHCALLTQDGMFSGGVTCPDLIMFS